MKLKHRNSQKRIYVPDGIYFVTTKTFKNLPYFKDKIFCELLIENLKIAKKIKDFKLYAWVICYDHIHLLIKPGDKYNYSKAMHFIKRNLLRDINRIIRIPEGEVHEPRLRVRGGDYGRYWFIIEQHENKIISYKNKFNLKYPNQNPFPKFQWQPSFRDHCIRDLEDLENHLEYIAFNPEKHNLPKEWPFVSTNPEYHNLIDQY